MELVVLFEDASGYYTAQDIFAQPKDTRMMEYFYKATALEAFDSIKKDQSVSLRTHWVVCKIFLDQEFEGPLQFSMSREEFDAFASAYDNI